MIRFLTTLFLGVVLAGTMAACNMFGPKSVPLPDEINPQAIEANAELKGAVKTLSEEEKGLLMGFLMRRELGKSGLGGLAGVDAMPESEAKGVTVGRAIDLQRAWLSEREAREAQEKALAEQVAKAREAKMEALRGAVVVAVSSKRYQAADWHRRIYDDAILMNLAFANHTGKAVAGVKGTLVFADLFGDEFQRISIAYDGGIPVDGVATWNGSVEYNQFNEADKKLAHTDLDKLKVRWEPDTILFADGVTAPLTVNVE